MLVGDRHDVEDRGPRVADMDYSTFVGYVRERNRPSGGIRTVQEVCVNARLGPGHRVLEMGSNTGFTSVNLNLLTGADVVGIDLSPDSVAEARRLADQNRAADRVHFCLGDTTRIPFRDSSFDAVWASNVASFVSDKRLMLSELGRVLVAGGSLVAVPIYYRREPPADLVESIGRAIGTPVHVTTKDEWRAHFESLSASGTLELYYDADFDYDHHSDAAIDTYCDLLMAKDHLRQQSERVYAETRARLRHFMTLFNENLSYAGFSIMLFQKRQHREEIELFSARACGPAPAAGAASREAER